MPFLQALFSFWYFSFMVIRLLVLDETLCYLFDLSKMHMINIKFSI